MGEESGMRERAAGLSVMERVVRLQESAPRRSALARVMGVNPLIEEAAPWFAGATGEREVGAVLARLPEGWTAFHAIPVGRGESDIDHLVVGPGGVFTVNTKHHKGKPVWVSAKSFLVGGIPQPFVRNAELEASRIRRLLLEAELRAPVHAMVAVVASSTFTVKQQPRHVRVVESAELVHAIQRGPAVIDPVTVASIVDLFDRPETWSATATCGDTVGLFEAIARDVRSAAFVRNGWVVAAALAIVAVGIELLPR